MKHNLFISILTGMTLSFNLHGAITDQNFSVSNEFPFIGKWSVSMSLSEGGYDVAATINFEYKNGRLDGWLQLLGREEMPLEEIIFKDNIITAKAYYPNTKTIAADFSLVYSNDGTSLTGEFYSSGLIFDAICKRVTADAYIYNSSTDYFGKSWVNGYKAVERVFVNGYKAVENFFVNRVFKLNKGVEVQK